MAEGDGAPDVSGEPRYRGTDDRHATEYGMSFLALRVGLEASFSCLQAGLGRIRPVGESQGQRSEGVQHRTLTDERVRKAVNPGEQRLDLVIEHDCHAGRLDEADRPGQVVAR